MPESHRITDTLGALFMEHPRLAVTCQNLYCGRKVVFATADLLVRFGHNRHIGTLRFRCSGCGQGNVVVKPEARAREVPKPVAEG